MSKKQMYLLLIIFVQSLAGMLGSLFFSEVLRYPPCVLCWYQRICMYPIVLISLIGLWKNDRKCVWYIAPLAVIGLLIAIYHNLLYYKILPESIAPCQSGVSCTTKLVEYFGFVTIPLLGLIAFLVINAALAAFFYIDRKSKK